MAYPGTADTIPLTATNISLAAASGITARTAETWYPALARTTRVLVPIELDVLMVRNANQSWALTAMQAPPAPTQPPTPVSADTLMPPLFANLAQPRAIGAYLQWYLPGWFTSGTTDGPNNTPIFPPIPDRWLVLRIAGGQSALRRAVTGWVLEAGGPTTSEVDVGSWTESGVAPDVENPLTALGHGDLAWAGYFDNVNGRLGFQDNSLGKVTGPIAYLVCGWFSDPSLDPLCNPAITSQSDFNATMTQLGWVLESDDIEEASIRSAKYAAVTAQAGLPTVTNPSLVATIGKSGVYPFAKDQPWWPQGCLLHGAVVGIDWPGNADTVEAGGPPAATAVTVALGNTMAETMAALVSTANGKPNEAQFVEALELGILNQFEQPDGRAQLAVQAHTESFISMSGGPPLPEPITIAPSGPPQAPTANPPTPGPGVFAPSTGPILDPILADRGLGTTAKAVEQVKFTEVKTTHTATNTVLAESALLPGGLQAALDGIGASVAVPTFDPGGTYTVYRPQPRYFTPRDPVLLIQGGKRAFTHDSIVQTENGMIACRVLPVSELSWQMPKTTTRFSVRGEDILENGVENGSVPPECEFLLRETVLLDSGSSGAIAATAAARSTASGGAPFDQPTAQQNIKVEQTAWYAMRQPGVDFGPLLANSGIAGVLPAPCSVSPPERPWTPLQLQWSGEFLPSPNGLGDWTLDELDFVLATGAPVPSFGTGIPVQGRSTLTGGASQALSTAVANAIKQAATVAGANPVPVQGVEAFYSQLAQSLTADYAAFSASPPPQSGADATLTDIATALSQMDVLSCGLNGLLTQLRGGLPGDGQSTPPGDVTPSPFLALRAGFLRIKRLRLIDGFGQYLDLCGSSGSQDTQGILISVPLQVTGQPTLAGLPPRFSAPTRTWLRYLSATDDTVDADYQTSPVCGFLLPNHLEGSLEVFNADGSGAGSLLPTNDGGLAWQAVPGVATSSGEDPGSTLANAHAVAMARSLVGWGVADMAKPAREPVLSALLRTIDSTLWTVDPFGHQGDEHLALLLGHPVCVMRGMLRLDVDDTVSTPDNTVTAVPIRLGNLTQWVDGLLGYFVNDDYTTLYVADAASANMARPFGPRSGFLDQINLVPGNYRNFAADLTLGGGSAPAQHPFLNKSGIVFIRPGQTILLTMLVEPLTSVYATTGLVPRKEIGMRREWVNAGLAAIAPTFRFGPVLVDPQHIRMPLAVDLNGTWVWDYRAAAATWAESPAANATDTALLSQNPITASEGWLKLNPPATTQGSGS